MARVGWNSFLAMAVKWMTWPKRFFIDNEDRQTLELSAQLRTLLVEAIEGLMPLVRAHSISPELFELCVRVVDCIATLNVTPCILLRRFAITRFAPYWLAGGRFSERDVDLLGEVDSHLAERLQAVLKIEGQLCEIVSRRAES